MFKGLQKAEWQTPETTPASWPRHLGTTGRDLFLSISTQLARPDDEDLEKAREETAAALGLKVASKISAAQPKTLPQQPGAPTYIKYTPTQQGPQYNSGSAQRIIKMQVRWRSYGRCRHPLNLVSGCTLS